MLIAIDQLEELVTRTGPREQAGFLRLLDDALARESGLWVVATLRSEFLSTAPGRAGLAEVIDDTLVIEPLSRGRLSEVITRPAARAGLDFEPGLIEAMVEDTNGGDAVPMLAYTLAELADRADRRITHDDYEAVGGVVGALQRRADRLVDDLTRRGHGPLIVPTLLQLASLDGDNVPVRRRVPRSVLDPAELAVVDAFVAARLATSGGGEGRNGAGPATVEVSHEALLRRWEPLRQAIEGSHDSLRTRAELGRETADWRSGGRDASYLVRGNRLILFEKWAAGHPTEIDPDDREFLAASSAAADRERDAQRRAYRRLRWLTVGLAGLLVVSLVLAATAELQRRNAAFQASLAAARQLLAEADQAWSTAPDVALLLTTEALHRIPGSSRGEARFAMLSRLNQPLHISTLLTGHTGQVGRVAFTRDGRALATAGYDGTVRLWNVTDGRSLGQLPLVEPKRVRAIAFAPDGAVLAVVSGPTVRLWDMASRQPLGEPLVGHDKDVVKAVFSPDSALVATISLDTTIRLWDVATGRPHGPPLVGHTDAVFDAAFRDDSTLVSAGWDGDVRLWDVRTGSAGPVLHGHEGHATLVAISAGGSTVVSAGQDGTARVWDVAAGRPRYVLAGHLGPVSSLAVSPDGATVATGDDRTVRLWSAATGMPLGPALTGHADVVIALRFLSSGSVVSGSLDGTLRIWDVAGVSAVEPPLTGHDGWINAIAVSPDGTTLASASGDGTARLWQVEPTRALGGALAGGGPGPFHDVAIGPRDVIAAAGGDGVVYLWDARTRAPAGRLAGHRGSVAAVAFGPDGVLASAGDDSTIRFWDVTTGRAARPAITAGEPVRDLAFSADGRLMASAGVNGSLRLWQVDTGRLVGTLSGHERTVNAVAFGPGAVLASGGDDETLRLWDTTTLQPLGGPVPIGGTVQGVAFSPDGSMIAAGGSTASVRFFDTTTQRPLGTPLVGFRNWVNKIAFSPDGKAVAAAADDRFQLWDVATARADGEPLIATGDRVYGTAFSPDGSLLVAANDVGVSLWSVDDVELEALACRLANRNLSEVEWTRFLGPDVPFAATCR